MVSLSRVSMADISRQKRYETELGSEALSRQHTVGQAVEHYLQEMNIRANGLRWTAFSRGVKLDNKQRLGDMAETDDRWTVMPEVSAGACGRGC